MFLAYRDFIIFKTNKLFNTNTKYKGVGGREIELDPKFDAARHASIDGEVVSVPKVLSHIMLLQNHLGLPSYASKPTYQYRWMDDIAMEVQVGDKIYFHFNTIMNAIQRNEFIHVEGIHPNRTWYVRVRYDQVFCAVREGKIIPIQGYTFVAPAFETWDDIARPTPQVVNGKVMLNRDGSPMMKPKDQWIVVKSAPEHKYLQGYVKHVGTPLNGDKCEVREGQKILYHRNADWQQSIEGHNYFTMRQNHIIGRFEEESV